MRQGDKVKYTDGSIPGTYVAVGLVRKLKDSTVWAVLEDKNGELSIADPKVLEVTLPGIHGSLHPRTNPGAS